MIPVQDAGGIALRAGFLEETLGLSPTLAQLFELGGPILEPSLEDGGLSCEGCLVEKNPAEGQHHEE